MFNISTITHVTYYFLFFLYDILNRKHKPHNCSTFSKDKLGKYIQWQLQTLVFLCYQREEVKKKLNFSVLETKSCYVFQAGLELTMQSRLVSNSKSSCLSLLSSRITSMYNTSGSTCSVICSSRVLVKQIRIPMPHTFSLGNASLNMKWSYKRHVPSEWHYFGRF